MSKEALKFAKSNNTFYQQLAQKVGETITTSDKQKAIQLLWIKLLFFSSLFLGLYFSLFIPQLHHSNLGLMVHYIALGLSGILLAFNASHDAAHNTFSKKQSINFWIYNISFNLQGVNAYLWRIRHKSSHHVFANVDGCDADIDNNLLLRLSPTHSKKRWHHYQHIYAFFLYMFYTLHWIFIKDFVYLKTKNLANLKNQSHPFAQVVLLFAWKIFYLVYIIFLPALFAGYSIQVVLLAFAIMHFCISIFFVHSLIISHLCMETKFPVANQFGELPFSYHQHQLEVSLDYHPNSLVASWLFGGFNTHSAHHLFPNLPHTLYKKITPIIQQMTKKFNYPYHELNYFSAVFSHYKYLKKLGA